MVFGKQRFLFTLAVVMLASVCGIISGYLLARAIAFRVTESQLDQYAGRLVADGEASASELRTVLTFMGNMEAGRRDSCSETEIRDFRSLIFESEFLVDAGRMQDGSIQCSAALGKLVKSPAPSLPSFRQPDGTAIYTSLTPYQNAEPTVIAMQLGNFYVVFTPFTRMHLEPPPMHYSETVIDALGQNSGRLLGEPLQAGNAILTREGMARLGQTVFATRCSIRFFNCVTAYSSVTEVVQANHDRFNGCVVLCGLAGGLFGLVCSLLYRRNKSIEQQLRRAIRRDKLRMVYQPIIDLASGRVIGSEALVRWTDEQGHAVGPDIFVRMAEQRGFVEELTRLVLRRVVRELGETLRKRPGFRVSINVTAADLDDPAFLPLLDKTLIDAAVSASSVAIEITEGSTASREVAIETIAHLRQRGHSVHIDDFGTGYSSLSYLHELSVDAIKIDQTFTRAIGTESAVVAILPQILSMAAALDLSVIVEGIETPAQASYFAEFTQPILGQGWLFGRPVPAGELMRLLAQDEKKVPLPAEPAESLLCQ